MFAFLVIYTINSDCFLNKINVLVIVKENVTCRVQYGFPSVIYLNLRLQLTTIRTVSFNSNKYLFFTLNFLNPNSIQKFNMFLCQLPSLPDHSCCTISSPCFTVCNVRSYDLSTPLARQEFRFPAQ